MDKLADVAFNKDMDIEIVDGDIKMDRTLRNSIRIALSTSRDWWGNQYRLSVGSRLPEIYRRGKLNSGILREIKQTAENALKFLQDYCDGYSIEIERVEGGVQYTVIIKKGKSQELWKFPA